MEKQQPYIDTRNSDKLTWLANQIFTAFPGEVTALRFYTLGCGCIYYQRVFKVGRLDPQIGICRDADNGACEVCMQLDEGWRDRVMDEVVVYNSKFQIETV